MTDIAKAAEPTQAGNLSADIVRDLIGSLFLSLAADTRRGQELLRDAIPTIVSNFQGLQKQVHEQVTMVDDLARQLEGDENHDGFIKTVRHIVDTFVNELVTVSQQSIRIVERVTLMGREVALVTTNVGEIDEMARTTRFIGLNALIEANRNGEAGKSFKVVADEVKRLAGDAEVFSRHIREAVERCQMRLNETREIVAILASHDMTMALNAQKGIMNTVVSIEATNQSLAKTLRDLDENVRKSIQALQFDDIMMQLLGSIGERIEHLRHVWLEALPVKMSEADGGRLVAAYARHRDKLEAPQKVKQTSVNNSGTAELF